MGPLVQMLVIFFAIEQGGLLRPGRFLYIDLPAADFENPPPAKRMAINHDDIERFHAAAEASDQRFLARDGALYNLYSIQPLPILSGICSAGFRKESITCYSALR